VLTALLNKLQPNNPFSIKHEELTTFWKSTTIVKTTVWRIYKGKRNVSIHTTHLSKDIKLENRTSGSYPLVLQSFTSFLQANYKTLF
jgi:hypothetical protein